MEPSSSRARLPGRAAGPRPE